MTYQSRYYLSLGLLILGCVFAFLSFQSGRITKDVFAVSAILSCIWIGIFNAKQFFFFGRISSIDRTIFTVFCFLFLFLQATFFFLFLLILFLLFGGGAFWCDLKMLLLGPLYLIVLSILLCNCLFLPDPNFFLVTSAILGFLGMTIATYWSSVFVNHHSDVIDLHPDLSILVCEVAAKGKTNASILQRRIAQTCILLGATETESSQEVFQKLIHSGFFENSDSKTGELLVRDTKQMMVFHLFCGTLATAYLLFPSFGVFELIPDNIPFIGNLDEAGALIYLIKGFWPILVHDRMGKPASVKPPENSSTEIVSVSNSGPDNDCR